MDVRDFFPKFGQKLYAAYISESGLGSVNCFVPTSIPNVWMWLKGCPPDGVWGGESVVLDEQSGYFLWPFEFAHVKFKDKQRLIDGYRTVWSAPGKMGAKRWPVSVPDDGTPVTFKANFSICRENWREAPDGPQFTDEITEYIEKPTVTTVKYLGVQKVPGIGNCKVIESLDDNGPLKEGYRFAIGPTGNPIGLIAWVKYENGVQTKLSQANAIAEISDTGRRFSYVSPTDIGWLSVYNSAEPVADQRPARQPSRFPGQNEQKQSKKRGGIGCFFLIAVPLLMFLF